MSDWAVGYALGIATGLAIGLIAGGRQKPWSELSKKERKLRIRVIAAGLFLLVAGAAAGIIKFLLVS